MTAKHVSDDLLELRNTKLPRHHRDAEYEMRWAADEIERLRTVRADLLYALKKIVALPHTTGEPYPDAMWFRAVDIARDVLAKAADL